MKADVIRVWIDHRHPIFRRGLRTCLAVDGISIVGESVAFDAMPPDTVDVVVFEADDGGLQRAVRVRAELDVRLVAIVADNDERVLYETFDAGVDAIHLGGELRPDALVASVRAAVNDNVTLPNQLLPRLLRRAATGAAPAASVLQPRELAVLGLLALGDDTQHIADELCYSERTVKNIVHDLLMKLNCRNLAHAVALATRQGII